MPCSERSDMHYWILRNGLTNCSKAVEHVETAVSNFVQCYWPYLRGAPAGRTMVGLSKR